MAFGGGNPLAGNVIAQAVVAIGADTTSFNASMKALDKGAQAQFQSLSTKIANQMATNTASIQRAFATMANPAATPAQYSAAAAAVTKLVAENQKLEARLKAVAKATFDAGNAAIAASQAQKNATAQAAAALKAQQKAADDAAKASAKAAAQAAKQAAAVDAAQDAAYRSRQGLKSGDNKVIAQADVAVGPTDAAYISALDLMTRKQKKAAEKQVKDIQDQMARVRDAMSSSTASGATVQKLAAYHDHLADSMERAKRKAIEGVGAQEQARSGFTKSGMSVMYLSQAIEDMQYGFSAIVNNIPMLAMSLGAGPGLAGVISMAAVAVNQLVLHWDDLQRALGGGHMRTASEEMEELGKKTALTTAETARLFKLKERQKVIDSQKDEKPKEVAQQEKAAHEGIEHAGMGNVRRAVEQFDGAAIKNSVDPLLMKQMENAKAALDRSFKEGFNKLPTRSAMKDTVGFDSSFFEDILGLSHTKKKEKAEATRDAVQKAYGEKIAEQMAQLELDPDMLRALFDKAMKHKADLYEKYRVSGKKEDKDAYDAASKMAGGLLAGLPEGHESEADKKAVAAQQRRGAAIKEAKKYNEDLRERTNQAEEQALQEFHDADERRRKRDNKIASTDDVVQGAQKRYGRDLLRNPGDTDRVKGRFDEELGAQLKKMGLSPEGIKEILRDAFERLGQDTNKAILARSLERGISQDAARAQLQKEAKEEEKKERVERLEQQMGQQFQPSHSFANGTEMARALMSSLLDDSAKKKAELQQEAIRKASEDNVAEAKQTNKFLAKLTSEEKRSMKAIFGK